MCHRDAVRPVPGLPDARQPLPDARQPSDTFVWAFSSLASVHAHALLSCVVMVPAQAVLRSHLRAVTCLLDACPVLARVWDGPADEASLSFYAGGEKQVYQQSQLVECTPVCCRAFPSLY